MLRNTIPVQTAIFPRINYFTRGVIRRKILYFISKENRQDLTYQDYSVNVQHTYAVISAFVEMYLQCKT